MTHIETAAHLFKRQEIIAIAILAGVLFSAAFFDGANQKTAFVSPEVQFADASQSGLSIVPASCPSNPHYSGECSSTPPPPPPPSCTAGYFCQGNDLYYRTAQCTNSFIQACAWGCAGSSCNPPPPPTGTISVVPALVHSGETTQVSWSATNVDSCNVTEDNPTITDAWSGANGTQTSSEIDRKTKYKLSCTGIDGSDLVATATVNIVPQEQEK